MRADNTLLLFIKLVDIQLFIFSFHFLFIHVLYSFRSNHCLVVTAHHGRRKFDGDCDATVARPQALTVAPQICDLSINSCTRNKRQYTLHAISNSDTVKCVWCLFLVAKINERLCSDLAMRPEIEMSSSHRSHHQVTVIRSIKFGDQK